MNKIVIRSTLVFLIIFLLNSTHAFATENNLERINEIIEIIQSEYKDDISEEQLIDSAIMGMFETLDSYSVYMTGEQYKYMIESLQSDFSGIGVLIEKTDNYIIVIDVIENSPAQKAGIKSGDRFITVNNKNVIDISTDAFVTMVRGPKGTKVEVEIIRENIDKPLQFEIIRDDIQVKTVEQDIFHNSIGYIKINSFNSDTFSEVHDVVKEFDSKNITKVIVDVRGNPGGYLDEVVKVCRLFVPKGPIVHIARNNEQLETYSSYLKENRYELVVLINEGSASASEIFAGAIKDRKIGTLIGTKTFGKGTVQTFYPLKSGDYIKLSVAKYLTPDKISIDGIGITTDIVVEDNIVMFEPLSFSKNIYLGQTNDDVLGIEQRLLKLGYTQSEPDKIYDSETREAVIKLKKEFKMLPNSLITIAFQRELEKQADEIEMVDLQLQKAIEVLK